jgi:hypothetical protein
MTVRYGDWEIKIVENAGEIPADKVQDEVAVSTAPLLSDIKAQLMLMPKSLTYIVGWRAIVWQNQETGQFKDISEEEYEEYLRTGAIGNPAADGEDAQQHAPTDGVEGNSTE